MFTHYRTQGFILGKSDSGEADRIFTIFTKDFGKLDLLARAERKITSKLRAGLEIFYLSEVEFIQGKTHKTLTDAVLIDNFSEIRKDLRRLSVAYKIAETLDKLVVSPEQDFKIWQLLKEVFEKLKNSKLKIIYYYFFWNLLSLLGHQPEVYRCAVCQKKIIPENIYFNAKEGGLTCKNCSKKLKLSQKISPETVKVLRIILEKNLAVLFGLKGIEKTHLDSLNIISKQNYLHICEN